MGDFLARMALVQTLTPFTTLANCGRMRVIVMAKPLLM
jgi:hypothetical protein